MRSKIYCTVLLWIEEKLENVLKYRIYSISTLCRIKSRRLYFGGFDSTPFNPKRPGSVTDPGLSRVNFTHNVT